MTVPWHPLIPSLYPDFPKHALGTSLFTLESNQRPSIASGLCPWPFESPAGLRGRGCLDMEFGCGSETVIIHYWEQAQVRHRNTQSPSLVIYWPHSPIASVSKCFTSLIEYTRRPRVTCSRAGRAELPTQGHQAGLGLRVGLCTKDRVRLLSKGRSQGQQRGAGPQPALG